MKIVLVSGIACDTRLGTRRDRVSPCATKAFPPYTSRVSLWTERGLVSSSMVDRAGGASSLSFDNEGPPDNTEIVLCVGGNGRVSGGSSWRVKKQTLGDGAHRGANHGGTSTYPTVRPNSPFVHLVSSETSEERAPGGGNVLAGGRLDLAVRCLPPGTWTVGDNLLLPVLSFPSILRTNSFSNCKCILCDVENFICFLLCVQDDGLTSLLSSTTTGNFLGGGEVASLSPPPLVGKMMGFGMFQKAPIASHANPRVDNPSPTPTPTTLGVGEGLSTLGLA